MSVSPRNQKQPLSGALADQERTRSVPKKGVAKAPVGNTHVVSWLPYHSPGAMRQAWSCGDFGGSISGVEMAGCTVLKFGGSSVGGKMPQILHLIMKHASEGSTAVVVSAMGKTTDLLIDAADRACLSNIAAAHEKVAEIEALVLRWVNELCQDDVFRAEITDGVQALLDELRQLLLGISLVMELSPATLDRLLSYGERLSSHVVASLLTALGTPAHSVDGAEVIETDDKYGCAKVAWNETQARISTQSQLWPESSVPVVTGFLGATKERRRTTLGRNGSDYTATLLGLGLGASRVIINTDVPGVFTADPGIVKEAYPVPELTYVEAMELSIYGSRMFHPRTILPLVEQRIPMVIRNTDDPDGPATVIMDPNAPSTLGSQRNAATCVTQLENLASLSLRSRLGQSDDAAGGPASEGAQHLGLACTACLDEARVKIHHATFAAGGKAVHLVIPLAQVNAARAALMRRFEREIRHHELDELKVMAPVALLSLVRAPQCVVPKFFAALTAAGVKVRSTGQGSDSSSVSCVIDAADTAVAVRCAHTAINLGHQIVSLVVLGNNKSSRGLLQRLLDKRADILKRHRVELRVVGWFHTCNVHGYTSNVANGRTGTPGHGLVEGGLDIKEALAAMDACTVENVPPGTRMSRLIPIRVLQRLRQMSCPIIVDCNRLDIDVRDFYKSCYQYGVHVVVSNAASIVRLGPAMRGGQETDVLAYDTCVGASVPMCEMIRKIQSMGESLVAIEGSLSGTCGTIVNRLASGELLSEICRDAIERGWGETFLRDDLSGMDCARKLVVIARQMGLELDIDGITLIPLVGKECIDRLHAVGGSVAEQVEVLADFDEHMSQLVDKIAAEGKRLAFLASMDLDATPLSAAVAPAIVGPDHPSCTLRDTEVYVSIERCGPDYDTPIIVKGSGCGLAAPLGILGDILKTAQKLQGDFFG